MNNRRLRFIVPAAVILLILLILLARCAGTPRDAAVSGDVSAGIAYLEALDRRDPGEVDQTLKAIELQELKDKRDEKLRQMRSGEVSVWSLFHDYVIMGDSRAVGFTFLQTLDNSRILGHYGDGSDEIPTHYEALKELNPSYIFPNPLPSSIWSGWRTCRPIVRTRRSLSALFSPAPIRLLTAMSPGKSGGKPSPIPRLFGTSSRARGSITSPATTSPTIRPTGWRTASTSMRSFMRYGART